MTGGTDGGVEHRGGGVGRVLPAEGAGERRGAEQGVDGIIAECGGNCMCATCHVYVDPAWVDKLEPVGDTEDAMLDSTGAERLSNSRLSCQIKVTPALDGLVVTTPESQY